MSPRCYLIASEYRIKHWKPNLTTSSQRETGQIRPALIQISRISRPVHRPIRKCDTWLVFKAKHIEAEIWNICEPLYLTLVSCSCSELSIRIPASDPHAARLAAVLQLCCVEDDWAVAGSFYITRIRGYVVVLIRRTKLDWR